MERISPGCLEHYVLHTFRGAPDFVPELDLVMELDGRLIGHVMYVRAISPRTTAEKLL